MACGADQLLALLVRGVHFRPLPQTMYEIHTRIRLEQIATLSSVHTTVENWPDGKCHLTPIKVIKTMLSLARFPGKETFLTLLFPRRVTPNPQLLV